MEIHIWTGRNGGTTIELTDAQEYAVRTILGLDVEVSETFYRCYDDNTVMKLADTLKKQIVVVNN